MKKAFAIFLALLLLLTGCAVKEKPNDVSVQDIGCPYQIIHKKDAVELTLLDGTKRGVLWRVEAIPEDICEVTQIMTEKEATWQYRLTGKEEGAAILKFTAVLPDESVSFELTLVVEVGAKGKTSVVSCHHREASNTTAEANGLRYEWNVDLNGSLNFFFINQEDYWSVSAQDDGNFTFSNMMSTPTGCQFSAQAKAAGQAAILFSGEKSQRTIRVVLKADDNGKLEVVSVQEQ